MPYKDREKQKEAQHQAYLRNREKYLDANKKHHRAAIQLLKEQKSGPCMDCGGQFHYSQMDFDHIRGIKKFEINRAMVVSKAKQAVIDEIAKCELVCSNCHRFRTWERAQVIQPILD